MRDGLSGIEFEIGIKQIQTRQKAPDMSQEKIKETKEKLLEINQLISQLDSSIRADAFKMLAPLYFQQSPPKSESEKAKQEVDTSLPVDTSSAETFFGSFEDMKPSDNVLLIAAWLYSQHGVFPITVDRVKEIATQTGLTIPNRTDNTLRQAIRDGKKLFIQQNDGWQPNVAGEKFLKEKFSVKKGTKPHE